MSTEPTGTYRQGGMILSNLTAMALFGILNTSFCISYASLIFSSTCPDYFVTGIALFLLGGGVVSILISLASSYPGVVSMIQDVPVAVSGLIAASLATVLAGAAPRILFSNIFIGIAISTLLTGICFLVLGYFRLGNFVRFIPYPVIGGFLAATGWLLFKGGLKASTGVGFDLFQPASFFGSVDPSQLICALVFGTGLLILSRRFPSNMLVTPGMIVGSILMFLLVSRLMGYSFDHLTETGWLLGPFPDSPLWRSAAMPDLSAVDWAVLYEHFGSIATIVPLSLIAFLLNSSGIEFVARRDLDVNRDLKATGAANLVTGLIGVPTSYVFISATTLATRIGATGRAAGILHGCFLLLVFFAGGAFLSFFPTFIAGGIPLYLGLAMMWEWLVDGRRAIPRADYAIVLGILLCVEFLGFLPGIGIGIVASVAIFVIRYSAVEIVKDEMDGSYRSSKDRSIIDQRLLDYQGNRVRILRLQGYIFFGTANSLYERIKKDSDTPDNTIRYIVMDMALVQGIDSSAVKSFEKMARFLEKRGIDLAIVHLTDKIQASFEANGLSSHAYGGLHFFSDLDHAMEWCEDLMIREETERVKQIGAGKDTAKDDLFQAVYADMMIALDIQAGFEDLVERMRPYLTQVEVRVGDFLYRQNEICRDVYFILHGRVVLSRNDEAGIVSRIRILGSWTITGEIGAFLGYHAPYDATVKEAGLIYALRAEKRKTLESEDPVLAADLQRLIITMLGIQLMKTT